MNSVAKEQAVVDSVTARILARMLAGSSLDLVGVGRVDGER